MNRLETWILRRALRRDYRAGLARETTTQVQRILYQTLVTDFNEPNRQPTPVFMRECFEQSLPDWFKQ